LAEAEAEQRAALAIREKLAAEHPDVTEYRFYLASSHHYLGSLLTMTGRAAEAEAEQRTALAIREKLIAEHPEQPHYRYLLAESRVSLGDLLSNSGRAAQAEAEYRKAIQIQGELVAEQPSVTDYRDRLVNSRTNLGQLLVVMGRSAEAEAELRRALQVSVERATENPKVPGLRDSVARCQSILFDALRRQGHPDEARDAIERAAAIREALVREFPDSTRYRSNLAYSLRRRGLDRRDLGELAAADARRALELWDGLTSRTGAEWFGSACAQAHLAGKKGSGVPADAEETVADEAMALLRKAVAMGYGSLEEFRTENVLDALRGRDDFKLLMMDLAMPADPFAAAR
jgi:tetratricopeptide (TPR) repeat protein